MSLLKDVTERQQEAITHMEGPLLVVAGAGSGKTRVITTRISYMVSQGVNPSNIVAITFTNKAANEMYERVKRSSSFSKVWISTFHKMCSRILRSNIERLGYSRNFTIYDSVDQLNKVKSIMAEFKLDTAQWKPRSIAAAISNAKNKLIYPDTFVSTASGYYHSIVAQIYKKYEIILKKNNALDFDDLLIKTVELFRTQPDILSMYQEKFRFILVDEYQDTNHAQYTITRLLASRYRNICVTGDPDQSIYGWRGADIRNIIDFERDYPDAKVVFLEQNYRSTKYILRAASGVIQQNKYRKPKALWTENNTGEKVKVIHCEDEYGEANEAAGLISGMHEKGVKYSDMAVFYRTNAQSRVLENSLRNKGIPYIIVGGVAFYQRKEIKDVLSYLRICINHADDIAFERIINVPPRGIGATTVKRLTDFAANRGISLSHALQQAESVPDIKGRALVALKKLSDLVCRIQGLARSPVERLVKQVIEETGYIEYISGLEGREAEDRLANIDELINAAHEYDINYPDGDLQGFLEETTLMSDTNIKEGDAVTLMTLHTAKGLEFSRVIIVGMEEGLLPHAESSDSEEELEEERRLCYVGITRAKKELFLLHAKYRTRLGQKVPCISSQFLDEIPEDTVEKIDKTHSYYPINDSLGGRHEMEGISYYTCAFESDGSEPSSFSRGEIVRHPVFGIGRILEVCGSRENTSIKVQFNTSGIKHLVLAYTKLEKITN